MTLSSLKPALLSLSKSDKKRALEFLIASIPFPKYEVIDEEVQRRMEEADADPSVMISEEEFMAHFRKRLRR
ncbi:MAG: hypothetical protein WCN98_15205 [Verrucomicrobiaceae bacterium]